MQTILFIVFGLSTLIIEAQPVNSDKSKIQLIGADVLESGTFNNKRVTWIKGNARFEHKGVQLRCDSAFQYEEVNSIMAFGHVRIRQGDTLTLTGDSLSYDGDKSHAIINGNVRLKEKKMTLTSTELEYLIDDGRIFYDKGGRIRDEENTLISKIGSYLLDNRMYSFKDSVRLERDSSLIVTDTLEYAVDSNLAILRGPTVITSTDNILEANYGKYYTETQKSYFSNQARVETVDYILEGDSLYYDNKLQEGYALGDIKSNSKQDSVIIYGNEAYRWGNKFTTIVHGNAELQKIMKKDTVFISADTLISINDSIKKIDRINAYRHVKIYKTEFQGICDSLTYNIRDSILNFHYDPILWTNNNQITSDTIFITLHNNSLHRAFARTKAFIVSEDTLLNHNQVVGRNMTAYFLEGEIDHVDVDGNGQCVYFAIGEDKKLIGMNFVECSNMIIKFLKSQVNDISFLTKPAAEFIPPFQIRASGREKLKNFNWRIKQRPTREMFK